MKIETLQSLIESFKKTRILVIGDLMLDEFIWGKVSRISPEAPVPILEVEKTTFYPGGAANVVRNLACFTTHGAMAGVVGKDEAGQQLLGLLQAEGALTEGIYCSPDRPTTRKTRIIARQQQVVRVDREVKHKLNSEERLNLKRYLDQHLQAFDGVIVEDYGKGLLDQDLASEIIAACRHHQKILTVDPNPNNPLDWSGATAIKPNRIEALTSAGVAPRDDAPALQEAAQILMNRWESEYLLITLGDEGMELFQKGKPSYHTPTRAKEVYDVTGAGDTVIALFTLALASGASAIDSAEIANHAAGIVVGKLGTATLSAEELLQSFTETSP